MPDLRALLATVAKAFPDTAAILSAEIGNCPGCGAETLNSRVCTNCAFDKSTRQQYQSRRAYQRNYQAKRRLRLISENRCVMCGKKKTTKFRRCTVCLEKVHNRTLSNRK